MVNDMSAEAWWMRELRRKRHFTQERAPYLEERVRRRELDVNVAFLRLLVKSNGSERTPTEEV